MAPSIPRVDVLGVITGEVALDEFVGETQTP
jgi:hypothetical protein